MITIEDFFYFTIYLLKSWNIDIYAPWLKFGCYIHTYMHETQKNKFYLNAPT